MVQGLASGVYRTGRRAACVRWLGAVAVLFLLAPPAKPSGTVFYNSYTGNVCQATTGGCLQAGMFGVLVGWNNSSTGYYTGNLADNGNGSTAIRGTGNGGDVGIGTGSTITTAGASAAQTWTGPIDFADTGSATTHNGLYQVPSSTADNLNNVTLAGSTALNVSSVDKALDQILSISNYYANYSTQTSLGALGGSATTIGVAGRGLQVFSATSINVTRTLTISGNSSDLIVINYGGSAVFGNQGSHIGQIVLTGGITPDQVLFNLTGTGTDLTISGGDTLFADFIVRGAYNVSNATLAGRILGSTGASTIGSNFVLNVPADATPEPGEWALIAGGLGALFYLGRRRSRRPPAA
jgi:hypothetical protein